MNGNGAQGSLTKSSQVVIVGASLAGTTAAEALRREGFAGRLTMIGDEPYQPYDRPPLSKQVLTGWGVPDGTSLPQNQDLDAEWRLGSSATGLDLTTRRVHLANGDDVSFDRLLICTGTRARPWPNAMEAALDGVLVLRGRDDATALRQRLLEHPNRVLVIGAGFTGSEVASVCREMGLAVTVAERGPSPLAGALGGVIGSVAADMQRDHGVDLRVGVRVSSLEGDAQSRLRRAHLDDGTTLDIDIAVVALGAMRNTEWLGDSGLAAGPRGIACDAGCRAFDMYGIVTDDVFAAGDVARSPHPLYEYQFLSLEHWSNATEQAEVAAHNMMSGETNRRPHLAVPTFWSIQFDVAIRSIGVPPFGTEVMFAQGSTQDRRFVAVYGRAGRIVAAVGFNQAKWLDFYRAQIESAAPFPPTYRGVDQPADRQPQPAAFPDPREMTHGPQIALTGHAPSERRWTFMPARP